MQKLKITLNEDGSVSQYTPDFKIMRGSYRNVLINIEVPHSLLIDPVNDTDENKTKTGNNVRVGGIITTATGKHLQTKRYEFQRVKDFVREGTAYRLYQRKMPKEFTMWNTLDEREEAQRGSLLLVINVINWLINDLNAKVEEISASPSFRLDIQPSAFLQEAEEIEEPSDFDILQSQVQKHDKEIEDLQKNLYGEGDETLGEFLTGRLKAGWKIKLEKEGGQIKISVETIKAGEVPLDNIPSIESKNVQKALEELSKRTDSQSVDSVQGEDEYLVDNTDPRNPIIKHDKSKIDIASIADNLTTSDNTKVLAASQGKTLIAEIENVNNSLNIEIGAREKADKLQDESIANLEKMKAGKEEMNNAIRAAIDAVVNSAPEAFDTLKEISDWIKNDEEGTSALVLRIGEIEKKNQEQDQTLASEIRARETESEMLQKNIDAEREAREQTDEVLTNSMQDIQLSVSSLQESQEQTRQEIRSIQSSQEELNTNLTSFKSDSAQQFERLTESQKNINDSVSGLLESQSSMASQLSSVSDQVTNIAEVIIPDLESKIGQSGGGDEGVEWTTLYDKDSSDPALNKGETGGLKKVNSTTIFDGMDFSPYNYVRFTFNYAGDLYYYTFNLKDFPDKTSYTYVVCYHNYDGSCTITTSFLRQIQSDGRMIFGMTGVYRTTFKSSSVEYKSVDDYPFYFARIDVN